MPTSTASIPVANVIQSRKFGVELEIVNLAIPTVVLALRNAGIDAHAEGYNHALRNHWKVVTDASVVGNNGIPGCEVVSPVLVGEDGLEEVRKVCRALVAAGATVNKTCGLHVHVNARDLTARDIAMTVTRYANTEASIDALVPVSRRGSYNRFCKSVVSLVRTNSARLATVSTPADCVTALRTYPNDENRFLKLNLESYLRHGTVEFRQHSGSVNAEKVCNWIRFCVNFVETSRRYASLLPATTATTVAPAATVAPRRRGRGANRRPAAPARVRAILADGCYHTPSEIASLAGIAEASIPAVISGLRRVLRTEGRGSLIRNSRRRGYYLALGFDDLSAYALNTPTTPTVSYDSVLPADDSCFIGLNSQVINYYQERISDLAA